MISRKLAHKVQNFLQLIMGYGELAGEAFVDGNQELAFSYLEKSKKAIRELSTLVNKNVSHERREV